jgi:hypothetical protein
LDSCHLGEEVRKNELKLDCAGLTSIKVPGHSASLQRGNYNSFFSFECSD